MPPQFFDKKDVPQAKFAGKEGFPSVPTSTSSNGVLQICRKAKNLPQICRQTKRSVVRHPQAPYDCIPACVLRRSTPDYMHYWH